MISLPPLLPDGFRIQEKIEPTPVAGTTSVSLTDGGGVDAQDEEQRPAIPPN